MGQGVPGVYKHGRSWWISYYDQFGRRHRERVGENYKQATQARASRLGDIAAGRFGLRRTGKTMTFRGFVEGPWRQEISVRHKPSTLRGYDTLLRTHLLPHFADYPLSAITRGAVTSFVARKGKEQRASRSLRKPNPNRPTLSQKTILNAVALLSSILEAASSDYEMLPVNPLRGILRRKHFPTDALRPTDRRVRVLEPEDFKRAMEAMSPRPRRMALVAALAGLRWGELVALRVEDADLRRNKLRITRAFYRRVAQTPKTQQSVRDVDMSPLVRRIVESVDRDGLVFSTDGKTPIGSGEWIKRHWGRAQVRAGVRQPVRWHDLRHEYVSLLIAIGKSPKYITQQAGHHSSGFTLDRYGHLFENMAVTPVEWPEDLLWPGGCDHLVSKVDATTRNQTGEQTFVSVANSLLAEGQRQ